MGFKSSEMLTWEKKYPECTHEAATDLTKGKGEPNVICLDCRTHWYKGKEYNPDEWDAYVNTCPYCGKTFDDKYTNHSTCGLE